MIVDAGAAGPRALAIALSEASSGLTGRVVDSFTNIQSVKLFAHAEREDAFGREAFARQLAAARAMNRAIVTMTAALTVINSLFIFALAALSIWLWTAGASDARRDRARQCAGAPAEPDVGLDHALDHLALRERRHGRERLGDDRAAERR